MHICHPRSSFDISPFYSNSNPDPNNRVSTKLSQQFYSLASSINWQGHGPWWYGGWWFSWALSGELQLFAPPTQPLHISHWFLSLGNWRGGWLWRKKKQRLCGRVKFATTVEFGSCGRQVESWLHWNDLPFVRRGGRGGYLLCPIFLKARINGGIYYFCT